MEIVKRARKGPFKFRVVNSSFWWSGKVVSPGDEIEIENPGDQFGLCQRGKAVPCDVPQIGVYVALSTFVLPGKSEKFEAKPMELVKLKAEDALPLMLSGKVIPKDESQWRPHNRRLKTDKAGR